MQLLRTYLKQHRLGITAILLFCLIFFTVFSLYHLPLEAIAYPLLLCILIGAGFVAYDFHKTSAKHRRLWKIRKSSATLLTDFPQATTIADADYQEIIRLLTAQQAQLETGMTLRYSHMVDYYTAWAHQIKTPIASMRLHLQNEDSQLSRRLSADLFRIEQYVEMVLMFLRLDSDTTDYVIQEYDLDPIVRSTVKKFAGEFISRKLRLEYEPLNTKVFTDEKWLSFVIEQLLSNALKYTQTGSITISLERPGTLCIQDTGIGIAPEDLPRIFEKGYTGYNGRTDKTASGIGLYLCKRICQNLGASISAESTPDQGTVMRIHFPQEKLMTE